MRQRKLAMVLAAASITSGCLIESAFASDVHQQAVDGVAQNATTLKQAVSIEKFMRMVQKPTTLTELLKNVKVALDHHMLLNGI